MSPARAVEMTPLCWLFALLAGLTLAACGGGDVAPLELHAVSPSTGTARGGQRLTVTGLGFGEDVVVMLGGRAARVLEHEDGQVVVRSPAGVAGAATLTVTSGGASRSLEGAFTYRRMPFALYDATEVLLEGGPLEGNQATSVDFDGDGHNDVLVAARGEGVVVLRGDGERLWQQRLELGVADGGVATPDVVSVTAGDFNGDGRVDLFLGATGKTRPTLVFGVRGGTFMTAPFPAVYGSGQRAVAFDADGDGDLDLLVTHSAATADGTPVVMLFTNDGTGRFTDASSKLAGSPLGATAVSVADFDGDGDPDIFFSMKNESCRLLLGDGHGAFQLAAGDALPVDTKPGAGEAAVGDLDGDGHLDLYLPTEGQDRVWLNDGTAHFYDATEAHVGPMAAVADAARFVDLDLDGHLDVVVVERQGRLRLLRNDGEGRLFDYSADGVGNDGVVRTLGVVVTDVEGDGVPELVAIRASLGRPAIFATAGDTDDADEDGWPDSLDACPLTPSKVQTFRAPFGCRSSAECQTLLGCDLKVFEGSAYLSCAKSHTFAQAKAFCASQGGQLVEIEGPEENAALAKGLDAAAWILLDDIETEGHWLVDGAPPVWLNWGPGQPDNASGGEDCASLRPEGVWNDLPCGNTARTLCEGPRIREAECPPPPGADGGA